VEIDPDCAQSAVGVRHHPKLEKHLRMQSSPHGTRSSSAKAWLRALERTAPISQHPLQTLPTLIGSLAENFGSAPALIGEPGCLTYEGLAQRANQYARWALRQGIAKGDVICLMMPNSPEYMAIWLGITRVRAIVSLINTNLTGDTLVHAINVVAPKHIIVGAELVPAVVAVAARIRQGVQLWSHGPGDHGLPRIDLEIDVIPADGLFCAECRFPSIMDQGLYIYTSGTSGPPKAANVSHFRLMQWSHWFAGMLDVRPNDRMFNCLPMYHSIGGVVATGAMLVNGASVVLRNRFSASRFWDDIVEHDCTLFQYIGELCRYLVNSPPHAKETQHSLRLCCGNGLRSDVWETFRKRFQIPQILEFYAATEANFSLYNCEGKPGAIGRIPPFLAHRFPVALVELDIDTGDPVRNEEGFCTPCAANCVGEAIGQIFEDASHRGSRFEGYTDYEASDRKVWRNVFAAGDAWFRSGDLMRRDEYGFFYFVDRIGDTFRWKGENIATTEVAEILLAHRGISEAVVYGVIVPTAEGRAGMAAIVVDPGFDLTCLGHHLTEHLPDYARPLFLRIRRELETTTTFKPVRQQLSREGYDPSGIADPVYFYDRRREAFVELDNAVYESIRTGAMRV
jgi:fatty-acyl-CoA synthase